MGQNKKGHVAQHEPCVRSIKREKNSNILHKISPKLCWFGRGEREREGEKKEIQIFLWGFSEFCRSELIELKVKVHLLDEADASVSKMRDFI